MYDARTRDICVSVETQFLPAESKHDEQYYVWAYHITIRNESTEAVQLISRHWKIRDGLGRLQEVRGDGVVGEQPHLEPGASFSYTSGTPLTTANGLMEGSYLMQTNSGERFEIDIPLFSLDSEFALQTLH
jgi:ApaG protein